jgi:membrane protease YdiL (CAAX protease family)
MTGNAWNDAADTDGQYSLAKILGIWAAATLPMFILAWVVFPALAPEWEEDPVGRGAVKMALMAVGLLWLFILAMIIVYREEGDLRWATLRRRLWLNTPRDPKTGEPRRKLWLWLIPLVVLHVAASWTVLPMIDSWVSATFPLLSPPVGTELVEFLRSPETKTLIVGTWWLLGLFLFMGLFNILGEEFLFRGVLLPKMNGVFGKWDWVANGVLGTFYHVHMPWSWLGTTGFSWLFLYALPAKYLRSTWVSVISHGSMIVLQTIIFVALIGGLM